MKNNWEIKKLKEIAKINYGYTEKAIFENIGPKFLRITDIQNNSVDWEKVPYCKCNDIDLQKYKLEESDIVFARTGATTGKSYLLKNPPKTVFASYLIRLKLISKKNFSPEYVAYYFQTKLYWDKINKGISGSAQGGFNATKLGELIFPIPLLPEQKCIVAILDKAFSSIDKAKQNALDNLKNAKELFESYLQIIFENKGDDWVEKKLGECFKLKSGDGLTQKNMIRGNYKVFGGNGVAGLHNNYNLSGENVIVGRVGALCGNVRHIKEKIWLTDNAFKIINYKSEFDFSFLEYLLNFMTLRRFARQAAQPVISNSSLKNVVLNFPKSKEEQKQIVQKLDALSTESKKLENIYQQKIENLKELKKSVLQKAFRGEL
ncbi:MAG: restriction endonuclease subunit S [Candidatus Tenebribacter burtonii]|jgi:type I restriction enzyme S subunit|nr:restriction endonuclease subunit S [Candidatus Tenebribacter burtonii]